MVLTIKKDPSNDVCYSSLKVDEQVWHVPTVLPKWKAPVCRPCSRPAACQGARRSACIVIVTGEGARQAWQSKGYYCSRTDRFAKPAGSGSVINFLSANPHPRRRRPPPAPAVGMSCAHVHERWRLAPRKIAAA